MNDNARFYLNNEMADRLGAPYYEAGQVVVDLATLREAREWDASHRALWDAHTEERVVGRRVESDAYGWYRLLSR